jgi:DNA ligase (NAD+)|nr:MAG TPA: DNA ligase [Bacteriophage sp.]
MDKFDIAARVRELNKASKAYYNTGQPIMSDAEFDQKLEELKQWEKETGIILSNSPTHNVGATVLDNIKEVTHKTPMLSLEKCHSVEEIMKFANNHNLVASVKLDGLTVRLTYKDGDLLLAESRGNGTVGSDITEHVKQFSNVPLHINKEGTYVIDGEALIKLDNFTEINKNGEYKNSRNLAAGTLSSLDTSVVKDRKLSWYAWEVVEGDNNNSFYLRLLNAQILGFDVVPCCDVSVDNFSELQICIDNFINIAKEYNLPQDGVVFKFDDVEYGKSLGNTNHHFRNGIAYKIFNDSVETELVDIEWTMGKTGSLCPTAVFNPIEIEQTIVERASLHNISVMKEIMDKPWIGQHIGVFKANLIIPQIRWAEQDNDSKKTYIHIPDRCPICNHPTKIVKDNDSEVLYCTNENCKGKLLGKLTHAASKNALNIDGLSESTIEKFINLGWLNSIQDIYHLSDHEKEMESLDGFGKKSVEKLLLSIEKSRSVDLDHFLNSLSIQLLGKSASKMIAESVDYEFGIWMKQMAVGGAEHFKYLPGVGNALINSLNNYFNEHCSDIWELSKEFTFTTKEKTILSNTSLNGKTFVITGSLHKFENRDKVKKAIEDCGGKVTGSVSKNTSFLVCNEDAGSSKSKKAHELGVPVITEEDLIIMLSC